VSRVGGNAQIKAMKSVSGRLRLDLAQFRELEAFSAFGSDLDKASKAQLERGARLVELLKQPQYAPFSVDRQVVSVWAGTTGQLDDVPVSDIRRFEREFLDYVGNRHKGIYDAILSSGQLSDDTVQSLESAIADFKKTFDTSNGEPLVKDEKVDAMESGDEGQETVQAHRRQPQNQQG
jgi:F-type H+-transporting ATPase subunit alpha